MGEDKTERKSPSNQPEGGGYFQGEPGYKSNASSALNQMA